MDRPPPPLAGVRVLDLCGDLGRFATKLLTELGASTVKPFRWASRGAPMRDPAAAAVGGVADWWFDGGKLAVAARGGTATSAGTARNHAETVPAALAQLAELADIVVDDRPPGWLAAHGLEPAALRERNPALVHVSLTAFGPDGPRAGWATSDLVAAALGGVCSLTGPADKPLNSWGRQNYAFGGFYAAIAALAGLYQARRLGRGQHVDVSLHEAVTGSIENLFFQFFYHDVLDGLAALAPRQGALHWLGAYDVAPAATGSVMFTPTPSPQPLLEWMLEDGVEEAAEFLALDVTALLPRMAELMALVRSWVVGHDAGWLFEEAQRRHVAFGEVQPPVKVVANPQFAHRGFFADVDWDGPPVRRPAHLVRFGSTPMAAPMPPPAQPSDLDELVTAWSAASPVAEGAGGGERGDDDRPLAGVRVVDFTWVLAGPFCTRMLGDLGADVVRVQNEARSTLVNRPDYPYFSVWNRSKRSALLDMKHPAALDAVRRLVEVSDVLIENYSAGVLDRWGLDWDTVHRWNPRLVYVTMSGCGHDGPWRDVISYAPTVHALCGLTYLTNPADRRDVGLGFSLNDHAAGFAGALAVLAALEARRRTGEGQLIDMAQLEVGSYLVGPALIERFANGVDVEPAGNRDGIVDHVPNDTYRCADGGWVAVTVTEDVQWPPLAALTGHPSLSDDASLATEAGRRARRADIDAAVATWCAERSADDAMVAMQAAGVAAGVVQNARDLFADPQHRARGFWRSFEDHPLFGTRPFDRFPARFSGSDLEPYRRSPYFGEHNFDVWGELCGYTDTEVALGIGDGPFQ